MDDYTSVSFLNDQTIRDDIHVLYIDNPYILHAIYTPT